MPAGTHTSWKGTWEPIQVGLLPSLLYHWTAFQWVLWHPVNHQLPLHYLNGSISFTSAFLAYLLNSLFWIYIEEKKVFTVGNLGRLLNPAHSVFLKETSTCRSSCHPMCSPQKVSIAVGTLFFVSFSFGNIFNSFIIFLTNGPRDRRSGEQRGGEARPQPHNPSHPPLFPLYVYNLYIRPGAGGRGG